MKKMILFVLLDQFADCEAAYLSSALKMLGEDQFSMKTVSLTRDKVESIGGFHILPDYDIPSVPKNYEALILVGGMTWRNEAALQVKHLVDECLKSGKILGGICDASGFLGVSGALNSVRHTSNDVNDLKQWAGDAYTGEKNYLQEPAVSDGGIITANGTAALEFAREVLLTLKAASVEKIMEWYNFHKLGYYNAPLPKM